MRGELETAALILGGVALMLGGFTTAGVCLLAVGIVKAL